MTINTCLARLGRARPVVMDTHGMISRRQGLGAKICQIDINNRRRSGATSRLAVWETTSGVWSGPPELRLSAGWAVCPAGDGRFPARRASATLDGRHALCKPGSTVGCLKSSTVGPDLVWLRRGVP